MGSRLIKRSSSIHVWTNLETQYNYSMALSIVDFIKDKKSVVVAKLGESLAVIVRRMAENDFSQLPVVDAKNKPLGVIDSDGLLNIVMESQFASQDFQLDQSMLRNTQLFTQSDEMKMLVEGMKGDYVLITSDDGELVQILTEFDVIQYFHQHNEGELTAVKSKFQEINQNRSEFLQHVSHELRTPLASIIGFSDVLLDGVDGELNEQMKDDVRLIRASGAHLRDQINELIDISKIETGRMELRYEAVDLHEIVESVLNLLRELMQVKDLNFRLNFDEKIGKVMADRFRVRQILNNVIGNAIKFTEEGTISLSTQDQGEFVLIQVSDTGIGIKGIYLPYVFDGLWRTNKESFEFFYGTNLSLPISKSLVEMHGGEIWLESVYGEGTTCFIKLPYNPPT